MKFNGQNIIADSDIVMTGQQTGRNLSDILTQHSKDINSLKGNVKWIYKYGGVGSGSGGGGGSDSSAPWNFRVELDDVVRESGTTVNLGQQREYRLAIQLYKVQGRTFTIKYTYDTEQGIKVTEKIIPPTQSSLITDVVNLQVNGTLAISISDDEGNYDQFTMDYIVTAYSFKLEYVYADDKSLYIPANNNIFVSAVAKRGLQARFTSIISVDVQSYYIEYYDWNQQLQTIELPVDEQYFYFDLGKELINDNSGNYQVQIIPHIILKGNNEEEPVPTYELSDNLIPDNIYLKVEVDGAIYTNTQNTKPYQFYTGTIPFFVTGFQGFLDNTRPYSLQVYVNDVLQQGEGFVTELQDQKQYELKIQTELLEWNSIKFVIRRKEETYEKTYYFYTKSPLGSFVWYPQQTLDGNTTSIYPIKSYQYKYSSGIHEKSEPIPNTNKGLISMTSSTNAKTYQVPLDFDTYKAKDCLLSIGINYNKLNDIRNPIILLQGNNSSNNIIIYQNKISIMGTEYTNFYLPIGDDQFHLIDVYRRAISASNDQPLFEIVIYIDGIIECALPGFTPMQETYNTVTLYSGLYQINYLEISYFNHDPLTSISQDLLEQYNPNPTIYPITFFTDSSILYHYYSYKLTFYPNSIPEEFQEAYAYVSQFYNNNKTGRIEVTKTLIQSIATSTNIPVLLIKYTEARNNTNTNWQSDGSAFMQWMEYPYDITVDTGATNVGHQVDVEYSKGKEELKAIDVKTKFPNAYFELFLQGTSTLNYKGKNFDLAINSPEEDYTYLYSPNFTDGDSNTFLPETRFTIKADIVDSSHSNNNAIGKFVNTISTKFEDAKQDNNKYSSYLKNTLEGFPVLLFLQNSYYVNSTVNNTKDDFYFLGISNFNLGRDSEFNLGFKDLRLLPQTIENGFAVTRISNDINVDNVNLSAKSYLGNLGVMEIRENRNYFDFSQSRNSILFAVSDEDSDYMFSKFKCNNQDILKNKIQRMVQGVSKGGGYIFDQLGKNMIGKTENDRLGYGYDDGYKTDIPQNIVPNYRVELERTFVNSESVLTPTGTTIEGTQNDLTYVLLGDEASSLDPLLDYKSLSEYYVICMALGLLDSVLKNMNFRKWKDKFYLAFYDMDTSLGKDNAGNNSDYICFSDYWEPASKEQGGTIILEPAVSYKDWYQKDIKGGYDVPSSYLFALAKYGYHILKNAELKDWYPQNVWARFRRNNTNISGWTAPASANLNHIGCLKNANLFIDNYFSKHLENVPDVIFNLNYRTKYLQVEQELKNSYSSDYNKFSGRRIHYVKDWLNSRFHLLDLYFNLASVSDSILTYDLNTKTWSPTVNASYTNPDPIFIDNSNKDILVLQDAFTSGDGSTKYSQNLKVNFTADTHSPLSLSGAKIARYITENNTTTYRLEVDCNGKALNLGGSGSWLTLSSIDTLIQGNKFFVNSDKLTTLTGTTGSCNAWSIQMPALKTVSLTSSQYSDVLRFHGYDTWPNLNSININNSKLGLNLDNVRIKTINAQNVGPASELTLVNCSSISTLNLNNSIFNKITMSALTPVMYLSKYTYTKNNDGKWSVTTTPANAPKCKYLTLTRSNKDGVLFISDQTYTNNETPEGLTEITLNGYQEIYIDGCPYLSKITIEDPSTVRILHITNSSATTTSLSINASGALNTINLEAFSNLTEVNFYGTKKFQYVYLPNRTVGNGVQLVENAFYYTNLEYLSGTNIKLNKGIFQQSGKFTLLQNDKTTVCSFDKTQNIDVLNSLFHNCNIALSTFTAFNNTYKTLLNKVTSTNSMWSYNPCVTYNEEMLLEDYIAGKSRFDLSMYTNVTSATSMMGSPNVTACHPLTLKGFASNATSVNMQNFYGWNAKSGQEITIPINWLQEVKTRVTNCNTSVAVVYKVVDYNTSNKTITIKTEFNPKDLFQGNSSNKITSLENWVFKEDHIINFQNTFLTSLFPKLTTITKSFVGCQGKNLQYAQTTGEGTEIRGFLYSNTLITDISGSFGFTNYNTLTINLDTYLDWATLQSKPVFYKGFQYTVDWDEKYHVLEFNKTISSVEIFNLLYDCLMDCYSAESLSHVFQNCKINQSGINLPIEFQGLNTTITRIPYLFKNLTISSGDKLNWDWNIINTIPNVIDFRHAFEDNKFNGSIPFNFFKRRVQQTPVNVFIKNVENQFESAQLYKYVYNNNITNLSYCFANCVFEIPTYIPADELSINKKARLQQGDTILDTVEYYTGNTAFSTKQILDNVEFDDMNKDAAFVDRLNESYNLVRNTTTYESETYYNYDLEYTEGNASRSILPTDFFYGCSNTANLESCFANTNLQGYIPDYLLKNCKNAELRNFLQGTLIFPKKYDSRYNLNLDELLHIYYYIGSNFCTTTNLDSAFNFRIHLPGGKAEEENQLHVFCFSDSFSDNLTSVKDALPKDINKAPEGCFFAIQHLDHDIYLNMMYDKASETTTQYEQDENGDNITTDSEGNPIELLPIIGDLGFKLSKFKNLQADRLVNELFSQFIYGNVFDAYTTLHSIKKSSDWAIKLGGNYDNTFGVSKYAVWPSAKSVNRNLIQVSYNKYEVENGNWSQGDGHGVKIYINNILDYNEQTPTYYNGSRTNASTSWGINFINNE